MPRYRVHLVVDRAFRAAEWQLPLNEPVWIVETPANRHFVTESTKARPGQDHLTGVSTFSDCPDSTPEGLAVQTLSIIDVHHGEYSAEPPYDALHVIGARMSPCIVAAAGAFGLSDVTGRDLTLNSGFRSHWPHRSDRMFGIYMRAGMTWSSSSSNRRTAGRLGTRTLVS